MMPKARNRHIAVGATQTGDSPVCGVAVPGEDRAAYGDALVGAVGLRIGLAAPDEIRAWSSGEVLTPDGLNLLTLKPEPGGLLCERIFGPYRDWECGCGRLKGREHEGRTCRQCGVQVGRADVRRERMGHVELATPVVHPWFLRGAPGHLALLLDCPSRALARVVAHDAWLVLDVDKAARAARLAALRAELAGDLADLDAELGELLATSDVRAGRAVLAAADDARGATGDPGRWEEELGREAAAIRRAGEARLRLLAALRPGLVLTEARREALAADAGWGAGLARLGTGGAAVREVLAALDLDAEAARCRASLAGGAPGRRTAARLRLIAALRRGGVRPEWIVLTALPVLPAGLRPVLALDGGRFAASDLNELYGRVIGRNNRLRWLLEHRAPEPILRNERRLLQAAVEALIDNGRARTPVARRGGTAPLKSLSDLLRGKGGRLRRNLLGKRVDYSGRSVIAVGPTLRLGECGLPRRLALELFKPFVMRELLAAGLATSARAAKRLVERGDDAVWPLLERAMRGRVVLLNRAPTLHMGSLRAFEPLLLGPEWGAAIRLHPLVCKGFNADFDGDQMAVHLPLSAAAQAEARALLHARRTLLSAADGAPAIVPQQDIVLGCYYLTMPVPGATGEGKTFADADEVTLACDTGAVAVGAAVRVRLPGLGLTATTAGRVLFHEALRAVLAGHGPGVDALGFRDETMGSRALVRLLADCHRLLGGEATAALADALTALGFRWSTRAGLSIGLGDLAIPPEKDALLAAATDEAVAIRRDYDRGLLAEGERRAALVVLWTATRDRVAATVRAGLDPQNPLAIMADSGARGNANQLTQLAGMRGLITDASGRVIERPVTANYREGIPVLQYFQMSSGARKGATDRALRTADAGYLTRRLVDVAQDVVVAEEDCGTAAGLAVALPAVPDPDGDRRARAWLRGRHLAADLADPATGTCLARAGMELDDTALDRLLALPARSPSVLARSPLRCAARRGVCRRCYGRDPATGEIVALGAAVGVIAAQSIGEPGTQLTMKTFQLGGVASAANITGGLPRVEELFEATRPRDAAMLAPCVGLVAIEAVARGRIVELHPVRTVAGATGAAVRFPVPPGARLAVADGARVCVGQALTTGPCDPQGLLMLAGRAAAEEYLVEEITGIYRRQGVDLDARHVEVIVRQMTRRVLVQEGGGTPLLPGELVERADLRAANAAALAGGGATATAREAVLGITRAALASGSFLAAASFQETTRVLADAALARRIDCLHGLKENVLLGRPIPAGTGFRAPAPLLDRGA